MTMKRLGQCLVLAGVCGLWAPNAVGHVVYHETFDHYGYAKPGLTGSCVMAKWPPSLKHLEFRPTKYDSVYEGGAFRLPKEAQGLTDYQFEFLFRFQREGPKPELGRRFDHVVGRLYFQHEHDEAGYQGPARRQGLQAGRRAQAGGRNGDPAGRGAQFPGDHPEDVARRLAIVVQHPTVVRLKDLSVYYIERHNHN